MELEHLGPQSLASVGGNWQIPPSHPPNCEDPPVLPSVIGDPLTNGKTGGRTQQMAFVRTMASRFQAQTQSLAGEGRQPHQKPPSGQRGTPWIYNLGSQSPQGHVSGTGSFPATQRTPRFPIDHTSQQVSQPVEEQCKRRSNDLMPGQGARHSSAQVEQVWAEGTHGHGQVILWGVRPAPRLGG